MIVARPFSISKGPKIGPRRRLGAGDHEAADQTRARAQLLAGDLMAQRARDAVVRQPVLRAVAFVTGRCSKIRPLRPRACAVALAIGMWQIEHSSSMSAVAPGWSIVSRRTAACQYGSRAALAIIEARQLGADRDVLARRRDKAVVAGRALVARLEEQVRVDVHRDHGRRVRRSGRPGLRVGALDARDRRGHRGEQQQGTGARISGPSTARTGRRRPNPRAGRPGPPCSASGAR